MQGFQKIGRLADLTPGNVIAVTVGTTPVAVFNVDGELIAIDERCPHAGGPLGDGAITGKIVTCPWHGWAFDLKKACLVMSAETKLPRYEVKVMKGEIFVAETPLGE
jgi:nitrite reductase (NADH) small subunit